MYGSRNIFKKNPGFTLVEALIVVVIIGMIISLSLPKLTATLENLRIQTQARNIAYLFNYVRECAIMQGREFRVVFEEEKETYYVTDRDNEIETGDILMRKKKISAPLDLSAAIVNQYEEPVSSFAKNIIKHVIFYPDGTATYSQISLADNQGRNIIISVDIYGRINIHQV